MDVNTLESKEGLTRSKVLKRAGVAAAAAWTVPFFSSSASAGVSPEAGKVSMCASTDPVTGWLSPLCQAQQCGSGRNGTICYCFSGTKGAGTSSGCCVCSGNMFCSQSPPCNTNKDCPRGWKCVISYCGQSCAPPCGKGIAGVKGGAGGKTLIG